MGERMILCSARVRRSGNQGNRRILAYLSLTTGISNTQKLLHTVIDSFPANIVAPAKKTKPHTYINSQFQTILQCNTECPQVLPVDEGSSSWHLAHKMFEEVIVEVPLSCSWHLTDHTAVIRALHLTGKDTLSSQNSSPAYRRHSSDLK